MTDLDLPKMRLFTEGRSVQIWFDETEWVSIEDSLQILEPLLSPILEPFINDQLTGKTTRRIEASIFRLLSALKATDTLYLDPSKMWVLRG